MLKRIVFCIFPTQPMISHYRHISQLWCKEKNKKKNKKKTPKKQNQTKPNQTKPTKGRVKEKKEKLWKEKVTRKFTVTLNSRFFTCYANSRNCFYFDKTADFDRTSKTLFASWQFLVRSVVVKRELVVCRIPTHVLTYARTYVYKRTKANTSARNCRHAHCKPGFSYNSTDISFLHLNVLNQMFFFFVSLSSHFSRTINCHQSLYSFTSE